jgi:hypothetical protein
MEVNQKHITTIRIHDAHGSNVSLVKEGADYHLRMVSEDNVVTIVLGAHNVRTLCQQLVQLDIQENWKPQYAVPPELRSFFFGAAPRPTQETYTDVFVNMARESCEQLVHR